jgi:hypothetical protein
MTTQRSRVDQNDEPNDRLKIAIDCSIPDSITTDKTPLIVSPIEGDDPALLAPPRRPFKKRLRQITSVKEVLQLLEDVDDVDLIFKEEDDEDLDELASSPPILERQNASVYAATASHRIAFEKQASSSSTLPLLLPSSAPKTFFNGRGSLPTVLAPVFPSIPCSNKSIRDLLPDNISTEQLDPLSSPLSRRPSKALYPSLECMEDLPENDVLIAMQGWRENSSPNPSPSPTKKLCHRDASIRSSPRTTTPGRVTPTPVAMNHPASLLLASGTTKSSRTSYEQVLIQRDSQRSLGFHNAPTSTQASALQTCGVAYERQSFQLEIEPNQAEYILVESRSCPRANHAGFELPDFLRTEEGRRTATVQDVVDILVIPHRQPATTAPKKPPPSSCAPIGDIFLNLSNEPVALKKPPPSSTMDVPNSASPAPPKEFITRSRPVGKATAPLRLHPLELSYTSDRKAPPSDSPPPLGSAQYWMQARQSCRELPPYARQVVGGGTAAAAGEHGVATSRTSRSQYATQPSQSCREVDTCARLWGRQRPLPHDYCRPEHSPILFPSNLQYRNPCGESSGSCSAIVPTNDVIFSEIQPLHLPIDRNIPHHHHVDVHKSGKSQVANSPNFFFSERRFVASPGDQKPRFKPKSPIDDICFSPVSPKTSKVVRNALQKAPRRVSDFSSTSVFDHFGLDKEI